MPKIENLDQAGPAWHRWRAGGLGGSDAPAVLGDNQWTSPDELAEVKLGVRTVDENEAMRRGKRLEPEARLRYQADTGTEVRPCCVTHDTHEWLRASLDGLSLDGKLVLEIKCPGYWPHRKAVQGNVPSYYKAQVQHQLLVTGADCLHYFSYCPEDEKRNGPCGELPVTALVVVWPDEEYMAKLLRAEQAFWERLKRATVRTATVQATGAESRRKANP